MNNVVLIGRLTKDAQLRVTSNEYKTTSFTLAVDRKGKDKGADFIPCVAWERQAEILSEYTHKGSRIGIDGHINTRSYDDSTGRKVYVTEVVADQIVLLDKKEEFEWQKPIEEEPFKEPPFEKTAEEWTSPLTIESEDLPF